ncbi:MAG: DUF3073 domain-containing protein [Microbacteriaceae bacterium]
MGRGRQKAKHTKVARDLKYFSPDTNYGALQKELAGNPGDPKLAEDLAAWPEYVGASSNAESDDEYEDTYDDESDEDVAQNRTA